MATFNTTTNKDAVPLSTGQKYQLFFKSATDPWPFLLAGFGAGIDQADDSFPEYGQGMQGYAKRFGAAYTDYFTGNLLGNAVLASLMKEDPRYFQKGTGSYTSRFLWAATSTVWCKRDNATWGPNYANVLGNLMGAAVSNLYYPAIRSNCRRHHRTWIYRDGPGNYRLRSHRILAGHRAPSQAKTSREAGPAGQGRKTTSQPAPQSAAPVPPSPNPKLPLIAALPSPR